MSGFVGIDFITGAARLDLTLTGLTENKPLLSRFGNASVDIQLSSISYQLPAGLGDVVDMGVSALASGITGAVSDLFGSGTTSLSSVAGAASMSASQTEVRGSVGSFLNYMFQSRIQLVTRFQLYTSDDPVRRGRPLMQTRQISTLPGFVMCDHPHIECGATASEISQIEQAMTSGFYWE